MRRRHRRLWQVSLIEAAALTLMVGSVLAWWVFNEQQFAAEHEIADSCSEGYFHFEYTGPLWLRRAVGVANLRPFDRVVYIRVAPTSQKHDVREVLRTANDFSHLRSLDILSSSALGGDLHYVGELTQLRELEFDIPAMTDKEFAHLGSLRKLQRLTVQNCDRVTHDGLAHLAVMRNLQRLHLHGTGISSRGIRSIVHLDNLEHLELWGTNIDDEGLRHVGGLTNLRYLGLSDTNLDGRGLTHLRNLINLQALSLSTTEVGDDDLDHLEGLVRLQMLDVRQTRVTHDRIQRIRELLPTCQIRR